MWLPTTLKIQLQWRKAGRISKQSSRNRTHRSMSFELCGTDDPDIQHAHWQNTAEQFFKKVRNACVHFAMIKKGGSNSSLDLTILRVRSDALSLFLSLGLSLRLTLLVPRRSYFHSFLHLLNSAS